MHSFLNIIHWPGITTKPEWISETDNCYAALSLIDRSKYLVRQSLILDYFKRVYNTPLPLLINLYANKVERLIMSHKTQVEALPDNDTYTKTVANKSIEVLEYLQDTTTYPGLISQEDIVYFMTDGDVRVPSIGPHSFYVPYIHFIVTTSQVQESVGKNTEVYFEHNDVKIPSASLMVLNWHRPKALSLTTIKTIGYEFNHKHKNEQCVSRHFTRSIYSYLSCLDLSDLTLKSILGILGSFAVEFDDNVITTNQGKVLKHIATTLFDLRDYSVKVNYFNTGKNLFLFLLYLRQYQGIRLTDRFTIAKILRVSDEHEMVSALVGYLESNNINSISSEQYNAFRHSELSSIKELDIFANTEAYGFDDEDEPEEGSDEDDPEEGSDEDDPKEPEESKSDLLDTDPPSVEKMIYKETVGKHIDAILSNPEDRSTETLAVLKNLKVYWLNLLSNKTIETILVMTNSPVNCNIKNK